MIDAVRRIAFAIMLTPNIILEALYTISVLIIGKFESRLCEDSARLS